MRLIVYVITLGLGGIAPISSTGGIDYFQNFEETRTQLGLACGDPPPVPNSYRWVTNESNVWYECVQGYNHSSGGSEIVCEGSGQWSTDTPVCELSCGRPKVEVGAVIHLTTDEGINKWGASGAATTYYNCSVGYSQITSEPIKSQCRDSSGDWARPTPSCIYPGTIPLVEQFEPRSCTPISVKSSVLRFPFSIQEEWELHTLHTELNNLKNATVELSIYRLSENRTTLINSTGCESTHPSGLISSMSIFCEGSYHIGPGDEFVITVLNPISRNMEACDVNATGKTYIEPQHVSLWQPTPCAETGLHIPLVRSIPTTDPVEVLVVQLSFALTRPANISIEVLVSGPINTTFCAALSLDIHSTDTMGVNVSCNTLARGQSVEVTFDSDLVLYNITICDVSAHVRDISDPQPISFENTPPTDPCIKRYVSEGAPTSMDFDFGWPNITEVLEVSVSVDVPLLTEECFTVIMSGVEGIGYKGTLNVTEDGEACVRWMDTPIANENMSFPDQTLSDAENYCRNPRTDDGYKEKPWCYTRVDGSSWHYCEEEKCALLHMTVWVGTAECASTGLYKKDKSYPSIMSCEPSLIPPLGTNLTIEFTSSVEREVSICNVGVTGRKYEGGCGEAPTRRGLDLISVSGYDLGDTADYTCAKGYHLVKPGSSVAECNVKRYWDEPDIECSDAPNIAFGKTNEEALSDNDPNTCVSSDTVSTIVSLGDQYEIETVTVSYQIITDPVPDFTVKYETPTGTQIDLCQEDVKQTNETYYIRCYMLPVATDVTVIMNTDGSAKICEIKIFGERFTEPLECYRGSRGRDYKGHQNSTEGTPCMAWTDVSTSEVLTFPDESVADAQNFCRNPTSGEDWNVPYCHYLNDEGEMKRRSCRVQNCKKMCRISHSGTDYGGKISHTGRTSDTGASCVEWSEHSQFRRHSDFLDPTEWSIENRCRNPGGSQDRAWCYTSNQGDYDYCYVPKCPTSASLEVHYLYLENGTDIPLMESLVQTARQCFYRWHTWSHPVNSSIYSACVESPNEWLTIVCHYTSSVSDPPYGDGAQWRLLYTLCPPELTTTILTTTPQPTATTQESTATTPAPTPTPTTNRGGSGTSSPMCPVSCEFTCATPQTLPTSQQLKEEIAAIQRKLLVDTKTLSSTLRKKESIYDGRPSSTASGALAIIILVLVTIFLISGDVIAVVLFMKNFLQNVCHTE